MLNQNNVKKARNRIAKRKKPGRILYMFGLLFGVASLVIGIIAFIAYIIEAAFRSNYLWALSMICIILGFYLAQYCYKSLRNL